jgi:single-strand DNA-binding protein
MSMEVEGSIKVVFDTQTFNSGFQKREFVVTTKEQYPQDVKFELIKERIDLIDPFKQGDSVKVHFNLRGNEYNGKYFVNLQAWRIEPLSSSASSNGSSQDPFEDAGFPNAPSDNNATEDDLPF